MARRNRYSRYESFYPPYVSVAERRSRAAREVKRLQKKGKEVAPVVIEGRRRNIATTFWGKAWCNNLESYSDYSNRLPRGRSYVRHGAVLDLKIAPGQIEALVSGTNLYTVSISIDVVDPERWQRIVERCAGGIDSVVDLLQGTISSSVMEVISERGQGLFPTPKEIHLDCSCPDWAVMCKHVAAALYGVGARLDHEPEMIFTLRGVDPADLLGAVGAAAFDDDNDVDDFVGDDLESLFGIDLDQDEPQPEPEPKPKPKAQRTPKARRKLTVEVEPPAASELSFELELLVADLVPEVGHLVTSRDLRLCGLPRSRIQSWLQTGVIEPTIERGEYLVTERTADKLRAFLAAGPPAPEGPTFEDEREARIYEALRRAGRPLTSAELRAELDLSLSADGLRRAIAPLIERGLVERQGQRRGTRYCTTSS